MDHLYVGVELYERVGPRCCVDFVTVLIVELLDTLRWRISWNIISGCWLLASIFYGTENVAGQLKRISCFSWEGPNLGEIIEKSKGDLLAEVLLSQGEETGLLLDDVTEKKTDCDIQRELVR